MIFKLSPLQTVVLFALTGLLSACPPMERPDEAVTFQVVADGAHSPIGPGEFVYRDAEEWQAVQEQLRQLEHQPSLPEETVLLAAVHAPTGGYSLRFDRLQVDGGQITATYTVREPGPECIVTQALTQPFQAIAVPELPEGEVRFVQRTETYSC